MNNGGEIDRLPVNQLAERYDIVRSAVYTRLDALSIRPEKVGNRAFVNAEQIRQLDDLHQFIQVGGTTAEFLESRGLQRSPSDPSSSLSSLSSGLSSIQPDIIELVSAIAAEMASRFQVPSTQPDPLAYFEALERAAQHGWLLSTSELAYLLDMTPAMIYGYGDRFSEAGFVFTRAGYRAQGEVAWRVTKPLR